MKRRDIKNEKDYNKIYQTGEIIRRERTLKQEKGSKNKTCRIENIED